MIFRPRHIAALLVACQISTSFAVADDVLIFAAASTAVALEKSIHQYSKYSGDRIRASYASSGALARQLDNGAPATLYLSANTRWMDWVEKKELLSPGTRTDLLKNRLVLIQSLSDATHPVRRNLTEWLAGTRGHRVAIADPAHAPAGNYAKKALSSLGFWKDMSARTIRAQTVRAALLLVERQETPYGIVYETDAQSSRSVHVLAKFPEDSHPPILYGLAILRAKNKGTTRKFYDFLRSTPGKKIFNRFGFLTP